MMLSDLMKSFFDAQGLTNADIKIRKRVKKELKLILRSGDPKIKLFVFGSSANGFGMRDSDIDIYLTSSLDFSDIEYMLEARKDLISDILFIPSTNVPIIKYRHQATDLMVDLSMNTSMSVQSTKLLKAYTDIDPRVAILGCFLKTMAKSADICDPSKRSLSSFAYCLLMIHFLQNHSQPVLPVLTQAQVTQYTSTSFSLDIEDLVSGNENRSEIIFSLALSFEVFVNINVFKHLKGQSKQWSEYGKNKESLRNLWLGFLEYYSKFDFIKNVVTINQIETLEKRKHSSWSNVDGIAIQNPMETDQNVARLLFKEMSDHIIKTIRHWQKYFREHISNLQSAQDIFDDPRIKYATAPINRTCYECGNQGHISTNCPYRSDWELDFDHFDLNDWENEELME